MTKTLVGGGGRPGALPPQVIAILSAELPTLAGEIIEEIRRSVPEYSRQDGPTTPAGFRVTVEQAMTAFLDQVSGGSGAHERRDELCRELGRGVAYQGRTLDSLQAAYRVGVQVAWRRVAAVARERRLPAEVMSRLAEALFAYIDELASLSVEGYLEVRSSADEPPGDHRLLRMVLGPGAATGALAGAAAASGWDVPDTVAMVALPAGARCFREAMDADVLVNLADAEPHLLIPGGYGPERGAMLGRALPERRFAVGLTVPLGEAADSLRWARRALALVDAGLLEDGGPTLCERHLLELWLLSDGPLLDQLARRELAALSGLPRTRRMRMTETLGAWLEAQGNAVEAARRLRLHPQTVRYRMRQISATFDRQLADPAARFVLDAVLRAHRLRERGAR
ncbi:PucR C-terminal helix-turn-helix domain-containing protein [Actinomadura meyerae]|uniref:PucR C-terminal helix-turn-helix domain-containing protein n=1 Tax=Actinomadura meyerae TaxID=240840 RepID=A0A239IC33_9ACTN|nr:PucR family transcriptional regulator [Actinomadura meyerae]SNS90623.1 PucR C-terminal helix-turn-helix domain-containing protein [Actinomadura meyerae]